jgi:hypothetical protein
MGATIFPVWRVRTSLIDANIIDDAKKSTFTPMVRVGCAVSFHLTLESGT